MYNDIMALFIKPELLSRGASCCIITRTSEYAIVLVSFRNYIEEIFSM